MTDKTQSEPCRICKKPASEHASDGCNHNHAIHDHDFAVTNKTQAGPQVKPHELCDFITDHGGTVRLDNTAFNEFSHKVWDTWEDGYKHGVEQQQEALQQITEVLGSLVEISVCSCSVGDQFNTDHHEQCDWTKVQSAIQVAKNPR